MMVPGACRFDASSRPVSRSLMEVWVRLFVVAGQRQHTWMLERPYNCVVPRRLGNTHRGRGIKPPLVKIYVVLING